MDIVLIRSPKHKGAIFLKVEQSKDHFICKVYPQVDGQNTERIAEAIKKSLERIPTTVLPARLEPEDKEIVESEVVVQPINIIFDGPPSHESGRFIEVETDDGKSINAGEWTDRKDGTWSLRITALPIVEENHGHERDI